MNPVSDNSYKACWQTMELSRLEGHCCQKGALRLDKCFVVFILIKGLGF